jgi:putative nucleotidyltransferase with HDIG domain
LTPQDPTEASSPPSRKPRILIADDDARILELLQFVLSGNGFEAVIANDGDQAWEALNHTTPDLAILDVKMPRRTGFDLIEKIRGTEGIATMPIILISGVRDTEVRLAGLMKGADDFLLKPFSPKELLLKCRRLLERQESHHTLTRARTRLEGEVERSKSDAERLARMLSREQHIKDALIGLNRELTTSSELEQLLGSFLLTLMAQIGVNSAVLYMPRDNDPQHFVPIAFRGLGRERLSNSRFRNTGTLPTVLLSEARPARVAQLESWQDLQRECGALRTLGISVVAPVISNNSLMALVGVGERSDGAEIPRDDLELLQSLCASVAATIETARMLKDKEQNAVSAICSLVSAMESKDPFGRGHTERVADYAVTLARAMGLQAADIEVIRRGAVLHDIGKIGIQEILLNKPGRLTEEEAERMRAHPLIGSAILRHMDFLASAHDIVRHHHERVDGTGYPDRLRGDGIALGARIVAVADSFDAMTTHRPYRSAMTVDEALAIMVENSGSQYDEAIVQTLVREIRAGRIRPASPGEKEAA